MAFVLGAFLPKQTGKTILESPRVIIGTQIYFKEAGNTERTVIYCVFLAAIYPGPNYFIDGQISLYECSIKLTTWGFDVMKVRVTLKIVLVLYVKFRPAGLIVNCKSQAPTG